VVDRATKKGIGPSEEILASQDKEFIHHKSMQTLLPKQWLNNKVINFFLKHCLARRDKKLCKKEPERRRLHFFNSFFVQTMFDLENNDLNLRGRYNYANVRRWSKKVLGKDIFKLKYMFCPINLNNLNWTLAEIFMEEKIIQYYNSYGYTNWTKLEGLLEYIKDEYRAKNGKEMDVADWKLVSCMRGTPKQRNGG
jgi:sentrin-specific protease 1